MAILRAKITWTNIAFAPVLRVGCAVGARRGVSFVVACDPLKVTTPPAGAHVQIDGVLVRTTPYKTNYPGGYFHKLHTVFGARLGHAMMVRIYKEGYPSQETTITKGPFEWSDLKGHSRGRYWLVKADEVQATLRPLSKTSAADPRAGPIPAKNNDAATERPAEKTTDARAFLDKFHTLEH